MSIADTIERVESDSDVDNDIRNIAADRREQIRTAHQAIGRMVDGAPMSADFAVLFEAVSWDKRRIDREIARERARRELVQQAGTNREFATAQKTLEQLREATPKTVAAIEQKIAELEADLSAAQDRLRSQQSRVESMADARKRLRDVVSDDAKAGHHAEYRVLDSTLGALLRAAESRLACLLGIRDIGRFPTPENRDTIRHHLEGVDRHHPALVRRNLYAQESIEERGGNPWIEITIDADRWREYFDARVAEIPGVESELQRLTQEFADREEELAARYLDCNLQEG